ncbi:MAG: ABC transporter permease, partial [Bacteroidales bacterium]
VWENLYFSTLLVYRDIPRKQIKEKVDNMLISLGLAHINDLKVGNTMNKKISGGQRKRLNIGLELIREPSVLFVDEPTSGLSSRDSENVMELLRELTAKGKLIFVVIHQPSSEIFKMFDKIAILDDGGVQIYYGNPVEAAMYFKKIDNQINSEQGECPRCGNVNPETIFNIIESRIVDEYGKSTGIRKVQPEEWSRHFKNNGSHNITDYKTDKLPAYDKKPGWLKQFRIFFKRDIKSKLANKQYVALNLLEAPFLAFLLAFVIRYIDDPASANYIFRDNGNIMPYLFICTIVAVFTGLIVSAEEIFKDRKIRKREAFLNLSRSSYLLSKMGILFIISAIQSILFVWVGNSILGIQGMYFEYWLVFFSLAALANATGLIISSTFNSAVTIYILIPFLIIPQMVLTGAMFSFDRINRSLGGGLEKVPVIAEFMPTRWAFEALVVHQFVNNDYERQFYDLRKLESTFNYKNVYYIPELKTITENWKSDYLKGEEKPLKVEDKELLYNEISRENNSVFAQHHKLIFREIEELKRDNPDPALADEILTHLDHLSEYYSINFNSINNQIDSKISEMVSTKEKRENYQNWYNDHYNSHLASFAKNTFAPLPLVRIGNRLIQKIDPVYLEPGESCLLCFRTHFLAPSKNFAGMYFSTFYFNVAILWIFTLLAYIVLYYNLLKKVFVFFEKKKLISSVN